jgi:hypothetical protein
VRPQATKLHFYFFKMATFCTDPRTDPKGTSENENLNDAVLFNLGLGCLGRLG